MIKTYSEAILLPTFEQRYEYLKLSNKVGESTFGYDRYLNQILYSSNRWKRARDKAIIRDEGCDLADREYLIIRGVIVHHINPLTPRDIEFNNPICFDEENLICTSAKTHRAIHYGSNEILTQQPIIRSPNDTTLW